MRTDHPPDWELAVASGLDEPGRVTFADRLYHRLEIRWRAVKYPPNLDMVLEKHKARRRKDDEPDVRPLTGVPSPWKGLVQKPEQGTIVHAGRFFKRRRWLVEARIVWPDRRDRELERAILQSVAAEEPDAPVRTWRAMGLDVSLARQFELHESDLKVGRVKWQFRATGDRAKAEELTIERLAMPDVWLTGPLRDWLLEQNPDGEKLLRQDFVPVNDHRGEQTLTRGRITPMHSMRGIRRLTLARAWVCPREDRVYHVRYSLATREAEATMPDSLVIRCCKPIPAVTRESKGRR
jgi:hypothetical protein